MKQQKILARTWNSSSQSSICQMRGLQKNHFQVKSLEFCPSKNMVLNNLKCAFLLNCVSQLRKEGVNDKKRTER